LHKRGYDSCLSKRQAGISQDWKKRRQHDERQYQAWNNLQARLGSKSEKLISDYQQTFLLYTLDVGR